jgi:hypothetical protein
LKHGKAAAQDYLRKCHGTRLVDIIKIPDATYVDWLEDKQEAGFTIISARPRFDGQWGWQCLCGNNSIMTEQEKRVIVNPQAPKSQEISEIVKNLEEPTIRSLVNGLVIDGFKMERV